MDLHISVFLLFGLFTAGTETDHACNVIEYKHRALMSLSLSLFITKGHSISCYQCWNNMGSCADQKEITCSNGSSKCVSVTTVSKVGKSVMIY